MGCLSKDSSQNPHDSATRCSITTKMDRFLSWMCVRCLLKVVVFAVLELVQNVFRYVEFNDVGTFLKAKWYLSICYLFVRLAVSQFRVWIFFSVHRSLQLHHNAVHSTVPNHCKRRRLQMCPTFDHWSVNCECTSVSQYALFFKAELDWQKNTAFHLQDNYWT